MLMYDKTFIGTSIKYRLATFQIFLQQSKEIPALMLNIFYLKGINIKMEHGMLVFTLNTVIFIDLVDCKHHQLRNNYVCTLTNRSINLIKHLRFLLSL